LPYSCQGETKKKNTTLDWVEWALRWAYTSIFYILIRICSAWLCFVVSCPCWCVCVRGSSILSWWTEMALD